MLQVAIADAHHVVLSHCCAVLSLRALANEKAQAAHEQLSEPRHMQPAVMSVFSTIATAVGAKLHLVDTHAQGLRPEPNNGLVDCSMMVDTTEALWAWLVSDVDHCKDCAFGSTNQLGADAQVQYYLN